MTEKTVGLEERLAVRWGAFLLYLIAAPFVIGVSGFVAIIPIFALIYGWPTYLIFGAPAFYLVIRYWGAGIWKTSLAGLAANLVSFPFVYIFSDLEFAQFLILNGCLMAPLWGAAFGWLYFEDTEYAY